MGSQPIYGPKQQGRQQTCALVRAIVGGFSLRFNGIPGGWCLVLSSAKIGRSSWRYYQRTVAGGACEYYTERGDRPGRWHGSGLSALGMTPGAVVEERELEALFGRALSPTTGTQLGSPWREDAITGFDLTFSAPKSVSTWWALANADTAAAIEGAHRAAVAAALGYLEAHASMSRRGRDGVEQISSAGFAGALFDHRTSRTGDPQLHTHSLVLNKVRCADGGWRTLDGREIYHHKKSAGAIYQAALRAELTGRLAVSFGPVSAHGQAEIAGVPEDLMAAWSTRTTAVMAEAVPTIADAEASLGRSLTADERARVIKTAVLATRPDKDTELVEGDLRARWRAQAAELGWDGPRLAAAVARDIARNIARNPARTEVRRNWTEPVMGDAVSATGRAKAIWSRADLTVQVAARIPTDLGVDLTARQVTRLAEELTATALAGSEHGAVALGTETHGVTPRVSDDRFASQELVDTEARILDRVISGGFRTPNRVPTAVTDLLVDGPAARLSSEQRQAAIRLVASRDLVRLMTAPAGAGKTTTLAATARLWQWCRCEVITLAPSARAAAELAAATETRGETVARWLRRQERLDDTGPQDGPGRLSSRSVLIVDEASMLTSADLDQLTARVQDANAALVLVGDPAQIGSVQAPGGMFEHLCQRMGEWTVELTELHRFVQPWEGPATLRLRAGDPSVLTEYARRDRIHPAASSEDAADAVFHQWAGATQAGRDALMLARAWGDVNALNARARAAAVATGEVTGPVLATIPSRTPSTSGQVVARTWRAGDVLIAKKNHPHIHVGDDTLRNGDRFRVAGTAADGLLVHDLHGRGTTILPGAYLARHAEYGWASTIDGAQGATADIGIVLARAGLDREHLYVAMTRGREENHVHTTPEVATGDAGPHRPSAAATQRWTPPPRPTAQFAPTGAHSGVPFASGMAAQATCLSHDELTSQPTLQDLNAALVQLTTAVTTSGREHAAHALLAAHVHASRERAWHERDAHRPARPVPSEHRRHLRDLERAQADLRHARDFALHVAAQLCEMEHHRDSLPVWARGRRRDLTNRIETTRTGWFRDANDHVDRAELAVETATRTVEADSVQRVTDERAGRTYRHQLWLEQPQRPYIHPSPDTTKVETPEQPSPERRLIHDPHRAIQPPSQGYGRSL
jgi:conjugative relaxase-like TrwC/TraI family protein